MDLLNALRTHRIVAIVRGDDADAALRTVLTLAEEHILSSRSRSAGRTRSTSSAGPALPSAPPLRSARAPF